MNSSKGWTRLFLFLFLLFSCFFASAQKKSTERILLKKYLQVLEKVHRVRFSYKEADLDDLFIKVPNKNGRIAGVIKSLEAQTYLDFRPLNERYIAIVRSEDIKGYCGRLLDNETGQVISGANISEAGSNFLAVSDQEGMFHLDSLPDGDFLEIRFLGYKIDSISIDALERGRCTPIYLVPAPFELEEAVVVSYLTSGISKLEDGSTSINTSRFGTLPGQVEPDVLQAVASLPGVESINETISSLNIRGGTSDQNLVLVNNIKMYLTGHFFGLISAFDPSLISRARLVKNGSSARLGGGVSGTLEIFSENELQHDFTAGVGIDFLSAAAFVQAPISDQLEFHVSARRSINDIINSPTYKNFFSRTFEGSELSFNSDDPTLEDYSFGYFDLSGRLLYNMNENQRFRLSFMQVHNDLDYSQFRQDVQEPRTSDLNQNNFSLGGTWYSDWGRNASVETTAYLTRYQLEAVNFVSASDQRLLQQNEVLETGLKTEGQFSLNEKFILSTGYQFSEVGISNIEKVNQPFFSSTIKEVLKSHSLYSEGVFTEDRVFLRTGLRVNYFTELKELVFEPRLSFNYDFHRNFSFKIMGEVKSQATSQIIDLQEDFLGVENRRWILADGQDFPLIRSRQISSGLDYKKDGWYIDVEGFYKMVEGISTSTQGFRNQYEFIRTQGGYNARGLEILINRKFRSFYTFLTYTYSRNSYHFEGLSPEKFPSNFDIRHSASLAMNYSYRGFKASVGAHFRTGSPYSDPIAGKETRREGNEWMVNYDLPNSERLPYFFRADFSSSYRFILSRDSYLRLGAGILNLLHTKNVIDRYYRVKTEDRSRAVEVERFSLGFTPNASLKLVF